MTPLIDVVFLLLLFFMLASTFARFAAVDVTLARQGAGGGAAMDALPTVFLAVREGSAFAIDGTTVPAGEIGSRLRMRSVPGGVRVVVRAAPGAVTQDTITAVDAARRADLGPVLLVH